MNQFRGFPARTQFTPIPDAFFSSLLPEINDIIELKVTLHLFWRLYRKRGYPRFVSYHELLADKSLMNGLKSGLKSIGETLTRESEFKKSTSEVSLRDHPPEAEATCSPNKFFGRREQSERQGEQRIAPPGLLRRSAPRNDTTHMVRESTDYGEILGKALGRAVNRGTILHLVLQNDGATEDVYFLNIPSDRRAVDRIRNGELVLAGLKAGRETAEPEPQPDIFTLYEQNIGVLTPMIAEELRAAEKAYPETWIRDAIKEAVNHNKRKWSYISAILERWLAEGRSDETYQRDIKTDSDKYSQQKYGNVIQR